MALFRGQLARRVGPAANARKRRPTLTDFPENELDQLSTMDEYGRGWPSEPPTPLMRQAQPPAFRTLRVYSFDPSRGRDPGNIISLAVNYEKLQPGPVGARIKVVDYDSGRDCFYDPVDLDDPLIAIAGGIAPSESNPHFHQQMVYAVASDTLRRFEGALGRTVHRRFPTGDSADFLLAIYPHGNSSANATYDGRAIFGYFRAPGEATGRIVPGQTVFTCLHYDLIVHTVALAIVDAVRPDLVFKNQGDLDTAAFGQGFCDISALLLRYANRDALIDTIHRTGGEIYRAVLHGEGDAANGGPRIQTQIAANNPFLLLGQGFAEALGRPSGLRSAVLAADRKAIEQATEPHERGGILLATVFDAFFTVYKKRSAGLFRIYRSGGGRVDGPDLPHSLAELLAEEARWVAERMFNTCVRALDFCPPARVTFGGFLRACITVDALCDSQDVWGVRDALMQAGQQRGIELEGAAFFSEYALQWPVLKRDTLSGLPSFSGLPMPGAEMQKRNRTALRSFVKSNLAALGLRARTPFSLYPLEAASWVMPGGAPRSFISTQVVQGEGKDVNGVTLVFEETGELRYAIPPNRAERSLA